MGTYFPNPKDCEFPTSPTGPHVRWSAEVTPRYLFRVQIPTSFDFINVHEARAQCEESSKAKSLGESLWQHVWLGNPMASDRMIFTCSLMWAITNARRIATRAKPTRNIHDRYVPLDEKDIAIFVIDTKGFPPDTFKRVWIQLGTIRANQNYHDYMLHGSLDLRGYCCKTTLEELNSLGLQRILRPLKNYRLIEGMARDINEAMLGRYRAQQYILPYPEEPILAAAVGMAKVFPVDFEIPMAVMLLSLAVPAPAERIFARFIYEFGGDWNPEGLSDLQLDEVTAMPEMATLLKLATDISRLKHEKDMRDLTDFVMDLPLDGGSADPESEEW